MSRREHRDPSKERFWRRMARQWRKSGLTARDFARQQGLSEHSFYGWLRTLRLRDQQAVAFLPVRVAADQPDQAAPTTAARMTRRGLARAASCPPVPATVARMTRRATTATPPAADGTGAVDAAIGS